MDLDEAAKAFHEFVAVIKALRTPVTGCPWDLEQDHRTLKPYLIEEAYEVLDAIDRNDDRAVCDELGDLLLQVVLHAQVADDRGAFSITEVVRGITAKMVRRHPHVFGSVRVSGSAEVLRNWEQIKAAEPQGEGQTRSHADSLARLPEGLPALLRAQRLGEKAAKVPVDSTSIAEVLAKVQEEFTHLEEHTRTVADGLPAAGAKPSDVARQMTGDLCERLEHQLGEVLFSFCQLARWLGLNAEECLRGANRCFVERLRRLEQEGSLALQDRNGDELEAEGREVKEAKP